MIISKSVKKTCKDIVKFHTDNMDELRQHLFGEVTGAMISKTPYEDVKRIIEIYNARLFSEKPENDLLLLELICSGFTDSFFCYTKKLEELQQWFIAPEGIENILEDTLIRRVVIIILDYVLFVDPDFVEVYFGKIIHSNILKNWYDCLNEREKNYIYITEMAKERRHKTKLIIRETELFERTALAILRYSYSGKYDNLKLSDKPDLIDNEVKSLGVEVTRSKKQFICKQRSLATEFLNRDICEITYLERCKLFNNDILLSDSKYGAQLCFSFWNSDHQINTNFKKKLDKLNTSHHDWIKTEKIELFIFANDAYQEDIEDFKENFFDCNYCDEYKSKFNQVHILNNDTLITFDFDVHGVYSNKLPIGWRYKLGPYS